MTSTTNCVHVLSLFVIVTISMFTVTIANKDWPSFGNFNYTDWWSRFGNHNHQINKTEQESKNINVGGSQNWQFGYNYSDWAIKSGPFYLNDTLVFKYDAPNATTFPHSVYIYSSWRSFVKCDVKKAKMVANHTQGVGEGFKFVLNKWKPYYFSCGEKNGLHCNIGQMKFSIMPMMRPFWPSSP
ncbi:uncharacterized protein LOC131607438 [Vicia villosa]|uniref:uncharacterized protein LOC131607438 n=1 Tax=Vicia villosa TaxID=3911 RepID=UPI00273C2717|nr:uncharacterized protein LOC131607438 [Vicia villosa]